MLPELEPVHHGQLYYHKGLDIYYRSVAERPVPGQNKNNGKLLGLWFDPIMCPIPTDDHMKVMDIEFVRQELKNYEFLCQFEWLRKFATDIGQSGYLFNASTGKIRGHGVVLISFSFLIDNWLEDMYRGHLSDSVDITQVVQYVEDCRQLFKTAAGTGRVDDQQPWMAIIGQEEKAAKYWKCLLIFLQRGHDVFNSDRLYRRWAAGVQKTFEGYRFEISVIRRAIGENRYLTVEEFANHRFCSAGLSCIYTYMFTEDHEVEYFSDTDMAMTVVYQHCCLTNDVLSYFKDHQSSNNKLMTENRVAYEHSKAKGRQSLFESMQVVCRDADQKAQLLIDIYNSLPTVMKPYMEQLWYTLAFGLTFYFQTNRFGWIKVDEMADDNEVVDQVAIIKKHEELHNHEP